MAIPPNRPQPIPAQTDPERQDNQDRTRKVSPPQSDPMAVADRFVKGMQAAYGKAGESDTTSRKYLYEATAIATILARKAHRDKRVFDAVATLHKELTGLVLSRKKINLGVAVLARSATTKEMRGKVGKMGRCIGILSVTPLNTVPELAAYLEEQGGIEKLIASKRRPALSPTELVVTCTPEQLEEVLSHEGVGVWLNVNVLPTNPTGMKPVTLLGLSTDTPVDASGDHQSDDDDGFY